MKYHKSKCGKAYFSVNTSKGSMAMTKINDH